MLLEFRKALLWIRGLIIIGCIYFCCGGVSKVEAAECVNIFYDRGPQGYWIGKVYATFLQNLLGHFPQFQQIVSPIELYQRGDIDRCRATFYIGSFFENKIPAEFYEDYKAAHRPVAWLGYSFWKLGDFFEDVFGYRYGSLTTLNKDARDNKGMPTFFRFIEYKGETFIKFAEWSRTEPGKYLAAFEQARLSAVQPEKSEVMAWARHSGSGEKIPYILRSGRRFYVADVPFSFMNESDRYLVFADILFDVLEVPPRHAEKYALVRVEDVHPLIPLANLYGITNVLVKEKIPFSISLIPIFFDPLQVYERPADDEYVTMDRRRDFLNCLAELPSQQVTYIWHGVTHQYRRKKNPLTGLSGADFEFWNAVDNKPMPEDSPVWVLNRLYDGLQSILKAGFAAPRIWLTPHYQASALDYSIFARIFPWNVGRVIYFDKSATGLPENSVTGNLWWHSVSWEEQERRLAAFKSADVSVSSFRWNGQFFPYEIFGDVYGQRLIPENLGNSQPYISDFVVRTRTVQDMVADAKRNRVLRDAWASFFYHPHLLEPYETGGRGSYPGDPAELRFLVDEIRKLGYRFVDLKQYAERDLQPIRPEPLYREK